WGGRRGNGNFVAASNRWSAPMPQPNDLSGSLVALDQNSTIIAVIEMSQSSWLVGGVLPGIERQQCKKIDRESRFRNGLAGGGNRIRTIGPAVEETPFPTPDVSFRANGSDLRHSLRGSEGSNPLPSSKESAAAGVSV